MLERLLIFKIMKTLKELQPLIIEWGNKKGLINPEFAPRQELKLLEEIGELANAIINNKVDEQKDAIGDIFVVLIILAEQRNVRTLNTISDVLNSKYRHIGVNEEFYKCLRDINDTSYTSFFYLLVISLKLNLDLTECVNLAYNEIKDRKGTLVNGSFIKE